MRIIITHPTKAYIEGPSNEIEQVRTQLTFTNKAKTLELKRHLEATWFQRNNPEGWEERRKQIQSELKTTLLFEDENGYWIRVGSISYLKKLDIEIENHIQYPELSIRKWKQEPKFTPYFYQNESVDRLLQAKHACISIPTGGGKSYILELLAHRSNVDMVVVTPSESIFNELLHNFSQRFGKENVGGYGDGKKDITKPITIAISKSLANLKPNTPAYEFFNKKQMLVIDESHTFGANTLDETNHGVLNDIPLRFYVSATQTRGDGTEKLLQSIIGPCVFEMSIDEAIQQGFLCPLGFVVIDTFSPSKKICKDPIMNKREHFLYNKEIAKLIAKIANAKWLARNESTLVLVEELCQIQSLTKLLEVPFGYAHAASRKEAMEWELEPVNTGEQVERFNKGEIKVLIGTKCIATGTNIYPTHNTINWVGGASEVIVKQGAMGRSTRLLQNSEYKSLHKPKSTTTIFDFNVINNKKLMDQLDKRIKWYEETKGQIVKVTM